MALRRSKARRARALDAGPAAQATERSRKRKRAGGSRVRRLISWSLVLGLWGVIAAVGTIAFVVSTLPPIQSLEVPKRPPTIEIVGTDGRPLIPRGESRS